MKVALLGATGFVGSALLKEALDRGHVVTAIVRHPERLEKREGLMPICFRNPTNSQSNSCSFVSHT